MEKEKLEAMMIEYVEGTLNDADRKWVESAIANEPDVAKLHAQTKAILRVLDNASDMEPSSNLAANFERLLAEEQRKTKKVTSFNWPHVYRMAAGLALAVSVSLAGYWYQQSKIDKLAQEMKQAKADMLAMLQNQSSAGQRLQAVGVSMSISKADDEIVNALVKTLKADPNTNVRLAALDALARFHEQPDVRASLIQALHEQTDPIVQIALIKLFVQIKEKMVLDDLMRLSTDELTLPAVQDEAHAGILELS